MKGILEIRNNLFSRGGVIRRMAYFRNITIVLASYIFIVLATNLALFSSETVAEIILVASLAAPPMIYLVLINSFKRLRDLRGTTSKECGYQTALGIWLMLPYISVIPFCFLVFAEGSTTGQGRLFRNLEKSFKAAEHF
jgi:uncharacterized membrane protein YhaH (DUF805 family)